MRCVVLHPGNWSRCKNEAKDGGNTCAHHLENPVKPPVPKYTNKSIRCACGNVLSNLKAARKKYGCRGGWRHACYQCVQKEVILKACMEQFTSCVVCQESSPKELVCRKCLPEYARQALASGFSFEVE